MNKKGFALLPALLLALILSFGLLLVSRYISKQNTGTIEPTIPASPAESPTSTPSAQPKLSATPKGITVSPMSSVKLSCDQNKDICFENNDLKITLYEGYTEDNDKWTTDQLYIIGQTEKGYELSWEGFPGEFTIYTPDKSFPNGKKSTVFIRAYKDVAKKGTYKGKVSVKSLATGKTTTADLSLTYADWNDNLIHTNPKDIYLDCEIVKPSGAAAYPSCINDMFGVLTFYNFGKRNHDFGVKSEPDKDTSKYIQLYPDASLPWRIEDKTTIFEMKDVIKFNARLKGFPETSNGGLDQAKLESEPSGTYKGVLIFTDRITGKELVKVPYTLNIRALSK